MAWKLIVPMPKNQITREKFEALHRQSPKRICFSTTHKDALKKNAKGHQYWGHFNVPFWETIRSVFHEDTDLDLFPDKNYPGEFWRSVQDEQEYRQIAEWIQKQGRRVFIRSLLPCCVALDVNLASEGVYTHIGRHEHEAKINRNKAAIDSLVNIAVAEIKKMPLYRDADFIAAVPPRPDKEFDLPSCLTKKIADELAIPDLTNYFRHGGNRKQLKDLSVSDKWNEMESALLRFNSPAEMTNKRGILLDDKYQSGVTMHYVAKVMQEAGMNLPLGLAVVKTWRDDDNQ